MTKGHFYPFQVHIQGPRGPEMAIFFGMTKAYFYCFRFIQVRECLKMANLVSEHYGALLQ